MKTYVTYSLLKNVKLLLTQKEGVSSPIDFQFSKVQGRAHIKIPVPHIYLAKMAQRASVCVCVCL